MVAESIWVSWICWKTDFTNHVQVDPNNAQAMNACGYTLTRTVLIDMKRLWKLINRLWKCVQMILITWIVWRWYITEWVILEKAEYIFAVKPSTIRLMWNFGAFLVKFSGRKIKVLRPGNVYWEKASTGFWNRGASGNNATFLPNETLFVFFAVTLLTDLCCNLANQTARPRRTDLGSPPDSIDANNDWSFRVDRYSSG